MPWDGLAYFGSLRTSWFSPRRNIYILSSERNFESIVKMYLVILDEGVCEGIEEMLKKRIDHERPKHVKL